MPRKKQKPYWEMTLEELREATKEFDYPIPLSKTRPLTKEERAKFEKARKAPHVSVYVLRNENEMMVKLDPDVRRRALKYAANRKLTISELVNRCLKGILVVVD